MEQRSSLSAFNTVDQHLFYFLKFLIKTFKKERGEYTSPFPACIYRKLLMPMKRIGFNVNQKNLFPLSGNQYPGF